MRLINRSPLLQRIPARLVGVGVRPEHVHSPEASPAAESDHFGSPVHSLRARWRSHVE